MRDTVDDWKSRVSIARREAGDFRRQIAFVFFLSAAFWTFVMSLAVWFSLPPTWLVIVGMAATVLSIGAIIGEASQRLYTQNAYTEMTVSCLEADLENLTNQVQGLQAEMGRVGSLSRDYRV